MDNQGQRIALITGGSRGLGKEAALRLAESGVGVVITYKDNSKAAQETVAQIRGTGQKASALALDLEKSESFPGFILGLKKALEEMGSHGNLDILVNNAGIGGHALLNQTSEALFDQLMKIQFKGPFFLTQLLLPIMNDSGRIINVSSGLTRFTIPGYGAYSAMKGAMEVYTRYLAKELGARGITVNIIAPGAIDNDFNKDLFDHMPQMKGILAEQTALGRVGVSEDVGGVVSFLASDSARWITGQRIEVSGGMFL